ncbi:MAG: hypothetical protein BJ554DRAFT_4613, partial [Olpidium bornovanus]
PDKPFDPASGRLRLFLLLIGIGRVARNKVFGLESGRCWLGEDCLPKLPRREQVSGAIQILGRAVNRLTGQASLPCGRATPERIKRDNRRWVDAVGRLARSAKHSTRAPTHDRLEPQT